MLTRTGPAALERRMTRPQDLATNASSEAQSCTTAGVRGGAVTVWDLRTTPRPLPVGASKTSTRH
jgi:hypothetical protein